MSKSQGSISRRELCAGAAAVGLWATTAIAREPAVGDAIAKTRHGLVRGRKSESLYTFKGIRFGATTEGRRFMPPLPPKPWKGVQDAFEYGPAAPQLNPSNQVFTKSSLIESEDCLFLNVWTPGLRDGRKRPVMVWLHPGGYFVGVASSGNIPSMPEGSKLSARGDVVVVSLGHRLNEFGYLALGHLAPDLADSGNSGHLDMLLGLKWVRDNIAEFGGDPDNVTIFGESGGGGKVSTFMGMPAAAGLFHKAIVQSGAHLTIAEPDRAKEEAAKVLAIAGLQPNEVDKLRTMPMEQLRDAVANSYRSAPDVRPLPLLPRFQPVRDGRSFIQHPWRPAAPEFTKNVPMMVCTTMDETRSLGGTDVMEAMKWTWDDLPDRLAAAFANLESPVRWDPERSGPIRPAMPRAEIDRVISEMRSIDPGAEPGDVYFTATTEYSFHRQAIQQTEVKAAQAAQGGAPAYAVLFAWESKRRGGVYRAAHGSDVPVLFDNANENEEGPEIKKLVDEMSNAWIRFARTGDPGWPAYTLEKRTTMVLDRNSAVVDDPRKPYRQLFADLDGG